MFTKLDVTRLLSFYGYNSIKYPKISNTKVFEKMTYANRNSKDPDQTAPEGAVWSGSTLFAIPLSILRNGCIKNKIYVKIVWNKVFEILGHLQYLNTLLSPKTAEHKQLFFACLWVGLIL